MASEPTELELELLTEAMAREHRAYEFDRDGYHADAIACRGVAARLRARAALCAELVQTWPLSGAFRRLTGPLDASAAPPTSSGEPVAEKRTCNRHDDCDAANAKAKAAGRLAADHCHDSCCEDCFGQ